VPFTVKDAPTSAVVAVTEIVLVVATTFAEYVLVLLVKLGDKVPELIVNPERFAFEETHFAYRVKLLLMDTVAESEYAVPVPFELEVHPANAYPERVKVLATSEVETPLATS
jgi:hypothetical protein